ncbi:hypothetical protein Tco_0826933 [Tanacetum coccineum]
MIQQKIAESVEAAENAEDSRECRKFQKLINVTGIDDGSFRSKMDDINVSDDDLDFVRSNRDFVGFVSMLDTQSITRHIDRVADVKEDVVEVLYEKRRRKKSLALIMIIPFSMKLIL